MRKFLFIFLFLLLGVKGFAQLDTEHWFAPMFDRNSAGNYYSSSSRQYIFLSTNEATPFDVEIYSGNTLITTIKNLSKGNPKNYSIAQRYIISKDFSELGKVSKKGLYLKASKKFFANLRFSTFNHAEILTSKGQAGIGNKFYAVVTPISYSSDIINFSIGILATEDNTKVKISGYDSRVRFTNISPTPESVEITLNKGESYILEGDAYNKNKTGVIGAKIEADKPIGVTNGNFNGQYAYKGVNSDIIMDQSVPVERLGDEFAIVKGNGTIGTNMEGAIIVATEDNTEIYVNNETIPLATLNEGEYYVVPDTKFINRGNEHYNLYIKSSKNIYLYQLLGGTSSDNPSYNATAGFNYIPPLNCFLPNQVGEIGMINTMNGEAWQGEYYTVPTKLNFITMKGAVVNVENYTLTAANGPFVIDGTSEWVTYSIPDVRGNINITSTKSITAGISAGDGAIGYGGYFSGFSTVVSIKRKGDCIPNTILEIEGDYDTYQWKKNGIDIVGAIAKTYTPTEAGNYSVTIGRANCTKTTAEVKISNCLVETTINESICGAKVFTPVFKNSKQAIDLSTLKILTQPQKGTLNVDANTGQITYTPNIGQTGVDTFSYQFSGQDANFPDSELVTVNLTLGKFDLKNAKLNVCKINGVGIFDLTSANIGDTTNYAIKYYPTMVDAENDTNEIINPTSYSSVGGKVYAKAKSNGGCLGIVEISLEFYPEVVVNTTNYDATHCDVNFDGKIDVNFTEVTRLITSSGNSVKYYLSQTDAENDTNALPNVWSYSTNTDVYVRVVSPEGCFVTDKISFKVKDKLSLLTTAYTETICDTNTDAKVNVDLSDYLKQFTSSTSARATYYLSLLDAQNATNAVVAQREINHGEKYYVRIEDSGACANIAELTFNVKIPLKRATIKACPINGVGVFDLTTADVGNVNNYHLKYYPSIVDRTNGTNEITNPASYSSGGGIIYVKAITDRVCEDTGEISLELYTLPNVNVANYTSTHCDVNFDGKIDVNFTEVTKLITSSGNSVKYYLSQTDAENDTNALPNAWSYSTNTDVYVRVVSPEGCFVTDKISFKIKDKLSLIKQSETIKLCDTDLDGIIKVNLKDYQSLFTTETAAGTYYETLLDAQNGVNALLPEVNATNGKTYYLRLENSSACPNIAQITFSINLPQGSSTLKDVKVCSTDTTILDAGTGFVSYLWSTGETSQSIIAGVGQYWVDLTTTNGCVYRQSVNVTAIEVPKIESVDIKEDRAIVNVIGGTAPYEYSLNGGGWQTSNVFTNLVKGNKYRVAVRSKSGCEATYYDFSVIKLINLITPNGDGINDVIDYSDLRAKSNAKFSIYDRYGALVFEGNNSNQFIWDGKANGRPLPTASYWYLIEWREPNTNTWVKTSSWILLRNRD